MGAAAKPTRPTVEGRHRPAEGGGAGARSSPTPMRSWRPPSAVHNVNDFIYRKPKSSRSTCKAMRLIRMQPQDFEQMVRARNGSGEMVPFSAFATRSGPRGPPRSRASTARPRSRSVGRPAPGVSSGAAMDKMEELVGEARWRLHRVVDWAFLPGTPGRLARHTLLYARLHSGRVPQPRRALRELVDSVLGDPRRADRRTRCASRRPKFCRSSRMTSISRSACSPPSA